MKNLFRLDHIIMRLIFGRRWREKLWATKKDKSDLAGQIAYQSAKILSDAHSLNPISINSQTNRSIFNPSFVRSNHHYILSARSAKWNCYNDSLYLNQSADREDVNYLLTLDKKFQVLNQEILDESLLRRPQFDIRQAMADIRLFHWRNQLYCIGAATKAQGKSNIVEQVLCRIENNAVVEATCFMSPLGVRLEKNWCPIINDSELMFVYSFEPANLFTITDNKISFLNLNSNVNEHNFRGGTPLIRYGDIYLGLIHHTPNTWNGRRSYTHSFVSFTENFQLLEISEPFFLQRRGLEFAAGICKTQSGILVSYGVADRAVRMLEIPDGVLRRYLIF